MNTKVQAETLGRALLKRMKGPGWKLDVWENLGWHYAVHNEGLTIHPSHPDGYFALLSDDGKPGGGAAHWTDSYHHKDPNVVVRHQMAAADAYIHRLTESIGPLEMKLRGVR